MKKKSANYNINKYLKTKYYFFDKKAFIFAIKLIEFG